MQKLHGARVYYNLRQVNKLGHTTIEIDLDILGNRLTESPATPHLFLLFSQFNVVLRTVATLWYRIYIYFKYIQQDPMKGHST